MANTTYLEHSHTGDNSINIRMKVVDIIEARILARDWARQAKQIMHDDKRDVQVRVSAEEAESQVNKFIDEFGHPAWSEEDEPGIGLWQYNWEEWIPKDGDYQRWFITVGWYVPSGIGMIKITRNRKYEKVAEAQYHGLSGMVKCPRCDGKGWEWHTTQYSEDDVDVSKEPCFTCEGEGEITRKEYVRRGWDKIDEATYSGNKFTSDLRRALAEVKSTAFNDERFVTDMSYRKTQGAIEQILGESRWHSMDHGHDAPYWLVDNNTIYISIERQLASPSSPVKYVTEVLVEFDPNGWST